MEFSTRPPVLDPATINQFHLRDRIVKGYHARRVHPEDVMDLVVAYGKLAGYYHQLASNLVTANQTIQRLTHENEFMLRLINSRDGS